MIGAAFVATNISEIVAAKASSSEFPVPFHVTARVVQSFIGPRDTMFKVDDGNAFTQINGLRGDVYVTAGDIVELAGRIRPSPYSGMVEAWYTNIVKIGHGQAPKPEPAGLAELLSGQKDGMFVRVRGTIQSVLPSELSTNWVVIAVNCGGEFLLASTPRNDGVEKALSTLVDSTVDIDCFCIPDDGSKRRHAGRVLHFSSPQSIHVVKPAPSDAFDAPSVSSIGNLQPSTIATLGRHRAKCRAIAVWSGGNALAKTEDGETMRISFQPGPMPTTGDFIEVSGYPESDLHHINISEAVWRMAAPFPADDPPPEEIDARQILLRGDGIAVEPCFDGKTVRLSGILSKLPANDGSGGDIIIESKGYLVPVKVAHCPWGQSEIGSLVEATGICVLDLVNWHPRASFPQVRGFSIVTRSASDLKILVHPPWWTARRLLAAIGALSVMLFAILIWNGSLRLMVSRKSRELLRQSIKSISARLKVDERTRLAVELHDSLAQSLSGVSMELDAATEFREQSADEMAAHLGIATRMLKSCRDELRNCLWDLRNDALDAADMSQAIRKALLPQTDASNLDVHFDVPRHALSDNTAHAVLRIVRELVLNAIRHGNAEHVEIKGAIGSESLDFSVQDDGLGFDVDAAPGVLQGHFGLQGVRERVMKLEGKLSVESIIGKGTIVSVSIPVVHRGGLGNG